jgi:sugar phosphate isomerase/epimerase
MFKYSYDALVYYGEEPKKSIERCAKFGYDAIELVGEPDYYDIKEVNKICRDNGIVVSSICSVYNEDRDLAHPDPKKREEALDYVKKVADFAAAVDCHMIIAGPTAVCKTKSLADFDDEYQWGIEGIIKGAEYAKQLDVNLCLECWNRYETYMLNRLDQAVAMAKIINKDNVGVMGDLFHMNIDESDIAQAIINTGSYLTHIHFADSNRAAPSKGHLDFKPILKALKSIDYKGYITFELLPAQADPFATLKAGGGQEFFDEYTELAINHIKKVEKSI